MLTCGTVQMDRRRCIVTVDGEVLPIRLSEMAVLDLLMCDPGRVWSARQLLAQIDPSGMRGSSAGCIRVLISHLRKHLAHALHIGNRQGFGWWVEPYTGQLASHPALVILGHRVGT